MLLMRCISGSHLYGTAHADSDLDIYEVYDILPGDKRLRPRQVITSEADLLQVPLSAWFRLAEAGEPRALEVMFAPPEFAEVDLLRAMRTKFHVARGVAQESYERKIARFEKIGTDKSLTHVRRLRSNLNDLLKYGRFDPTVWQ